MRRAGKENLYQTLRRNRDYILYYARILLRNRVAGSYLGVLWLFLDPLLFMLIYTFVVTYIFGSQIPNFHLYVFIGLTTWKLISGTILSSTTAVVRYKSIFGQVYFHKSIYPTIHLLVGVYDFLIANSLILVLMVLAGVPFTLHMLEFVPVMLVAVLFTYGFSLLASHLGVYFFDLHNILDFVFRFIFYLSPIMWSYAALRFDFASILKWNPISVIMESFRCALFYGKSPHYGKLLLIAALSCVVIAIGYGLMSRYEDEYGRVL